ncbi:LppX_LprAFG lipoprotein [Streptomyces sp. NPDC048275]|uniref:LppX_LprAFG lipoprotein n=1 Tax=Streptomyces sp. NPDC048275 TaxID=3155629 RepID=UPI0033E163CE
MTSAAFAVVLLTGGTVACGGGAESDSANEDPPKVTPAAAVAEAAKKSEDIASLHYRITGTMPEKGRMEAEASMSTEPLAMSMKMTAVDQGRDGRLEIRFVDEVMYVGGSAVASKKLDGRSWFRADPAVWGRGVADNNSYGVLPRQIEGSPAVQSTILTGSKDLRKIGTERIDGTRTTHYRGTVTGSGLSAARDAAADKATRERQIESLDQFYALGVDDTLTMDLWIDDDDRAKQFRMRGKTDDMRDGTDGEPLDLTITFLGVNEPVTVETPSAGDTVDLGALADDAQEGGATPGEE